MVDIVYKLTNQDNTTYNKTRWGPGVTHSGTGKGELCGPGFIHAYTHPLLAVLLNPIHGNFPNPKLWRCETTVAKNDKGLKVGGVSLTIIEEIPLPKVTTHQRVLFAFLCVEKSQIPGWDKCVELVRRRDYSAAAYHAAAARAAAYHAARAAAHTDAARADAARAAAYHAARAAAHTDAAHTDAARAAAYTDAAHTDAARAAAARAAAANFDLISIAEEACR